MAVPGEVHRTPTRLMMTLILTSMLLGRPTSATDLPTATSSRATEAATEEGNPTFPYPFWTDGKDDSQAPTTTSEEHGYDYYMQNEDLGTDPSTWKLLPIQIPDDLVSDVSSKGTVAKSSVVPPYPTSVTPQYGRHPGATESLPPNPPERLHQEIAGGEENLEAQQQTWDGNEAEGGHEIPQQQPQDGMDHGELQTQDHTRTYYDTEGDHKSHEPQRVDSGRYGDKLSQVRPEQHQEWAQHDEVRHQYEERDQHDQMGHGKYVRKHKDLDHHERKTRRRKPMAQQHYWDSHHDTDEGHSTHEPQHYTWTSHTTEHTSISPEPEHSNRDHHYTEANHGTLRQEHSWGHHDAGSYENQDQHNWDHPAMMHSTQHTPQSPQQRYHNWTHTEDGYEIKNYYEEDHYNTESQASNHHIDRPHNSRPDRPMAWNYKRPDGPTWHQNIIERLGQHLPKLPALSDLKIPGFGSLPRLPRLPQWLLGGDNRRLHQSHQEIEGEYVHKFYPIVPQNNPLEHLDINLDRHQRPHYKYPPRQDAKTQGNTLNPYHNTNEAPQHHSHRHSADTRDGTYSQQRPARPKQHDTQIHGHHSTWNEPQMTHQKPQAAQEEPQYTQVTRPPSYNHLGPQRILKVPHRQAYEGYLEKHSSSNKHKWTWEQQQKHTAESYPPQRDPLNRYPSPLHNWLPQEPTRPNNAYVTPDSTRPHSYPNPSHIQRPYSPSPSPSHRNPQYPQPQYHHHQEQQQQQQGSGSSWFSAVQEHHDNILDPLTNLLNRPSPFSIIDSSWYQQSIMDRLTGVGTSDTSTSFSVPGGLLVLGLALAFFYFNFVWYPTPVVTAKIFRMLSDSTPAGALSAGQQQAVGEVYQVFRSLEKEYKHDPSASSAPCRSRLVCQVHRELPGLWSATQAYAGFLKSSLAPASKGGGGFTGYQTAARLGSQGGDCAGYYKECSLPAAPVKAILKKLLNLLKA